MVRHLNWSANFSLIFGFLVCFQIFLALNHQSSGFFFLFQNLGSLQFPLIMLCNMLILLRMCPIQLPFFWRIVVMINLSLSSLCKTSSFDTMSVNFICVSLSTHFKPMSYIFFIFLNSMFLTYKEQCFRCTTLSASSQTKLPSSKLLVRSDLFLVTTWPNYLDGIDVLCN